MLIHMKWQEVLGNREKSARRIELMKNNASLTSEFHGMYYNNDVILAPFLDRKIKVSADKDIEPFSRRFNLHLKDMVEEGLISKRDQVRVFLEYSDEGYYDYAYVTVVSKLLRNANKNLRAYHRTIVDTKLMLNDCITKSPTAKNYETTFGRLKGAGKSLLTRGVTYKPEAFTLLFGELPSISVEDIKRYVEPQTSGEVVTNEELASINARLLDIKQSYTHLERFLDSLFLAEEDEFKEEELYFFSSEDEREKLDKRMNEIAKEVTSTYITPYVITNSVSYAHLQRAFIANVYMSLKNRGIKREFDNSDVLGTLISKYQGLVKILNGAIGNRVGKTTLDLLLERRRVGHPLTETNAKMLDIYYELLDETKKPHKYGVLDDDMSKVLNVLHHLYHVAGSIIYHTGGRGFVLTTLNETIYRYFVDGSRNNTILMSGRPEVFPFKVNDVIMKQCLMYDLQRIFADIEDEKLLPTITDIVNTLAERNLKSHSFMVRVKELSGAVNKVLNIDDSLENSRDRLENVVDNHRDQMSVIDLVKSSIY